MAPLFQGKHVYVADLGQCGKRHLCPWPQGSRMLLSPHSTSLGLWRPCVFGIVVVDFSPIGHIKRAFTKPHTQLIHQQQTYNTPYHSQQTKRTMADDKIEVTHDWNAQQWDWPLQHNDGVVKVHDTPDKWEVGLDVAYFTPNEIEVKVVGDHLTIHCKHEQRSDQHGSISREINRCYKLPDSVNTAAIKSHLTQNGVLRVTGQKK